MSNHEGGAGLRVYHCTSEDDGASWSRPQPVEQSLMMPSHDSYQFVHPGTNRIYVIYGYNDGQLDAATVQAEPVDKGILVTRPPGYHEPGAFGHGRWT